VFVVTLANEGKTVIAGVFVLFNPPTLVKEGAFPRDQGFVMIEP
jgi:hypothetical protein